LAFHLLVALAGAAAGAIASIAGFGIGSLLTPLLALDLGMRVAVAAVSLPHLCGTALRFWRLRSHVNRGVFWSFGVMSAAGGLAGALLHSRASNPVLAVVFGSLLMVAGALELTGLARRIRFGRRAAWIAGGLSGFFGGLVGNQGGIRSAGLLGFDLPKQDFVATATAIALAVDAARVPVYLAMEAREIFSAWPVVIVATAGVLAGTLAGARLLRWIPERGFRRLVGALVLGLGLYILVRAGTG